MSEGCCPFCKEGELILRVLDEPWRHKSVWLECLRCGEAFEADPDEAEYAQTWNKSTGRPYRW